MTQEELTKACADEHYEKVEANSHKELRRVVCAAIRSSKGAIICGARHYDRVMRALAFPNGKREGEWIEVQQGFIDQHCEFLSREEAWAIAKSAGQIKDLNIYSAGTLYSEDIY